MEGAVLACPLEDLRRLFSTLFRATMLSCKPASLEHVKYVSE